MQRVLIFTVISLSKRDLCRPCSRLHFLSFPDEHNFLKLEITWRTQQRNGPDQALMAKRRLSTNLSLNRHFSAFTYSNFNSPRCQKHQWDTFFSNLYLQSLTVGCCLKTLRDSDVLAHLSSMLKSYLALFLINELSSLVLSGLMCCLAAD